MGLRGMLKKADARLFSVFEKLTHDISPLLESIEVQFPDFTRHDPSHNVKIEKIAFEISRPEVWTILTSDDIFVLLVSLWVHDAAMGEDPGIRDRLMASREFTERLNRFQRLGKAQEECWQQFLRENHHRLCPEIATRYLRGKIGASYVHWIGTIAASHGERTLHDTSRWYKQVKVDDGHVIHPVALAVILRLADILHFGNNRAPEFMLQHRSILNTDSVRHWRAHQASVDYMISDGICHFDGVSEDDEGYWFADQFIQTMDDEVKYCLQSVLPYQDLALRELLSFSRVENRIGPRNFEADLNRGPLTLRVETANFLEDLLNSSLYGGKPVWFRELLQNCFDACRDRLACDKTAAPSVSVQVDSANNCISFADTGIGMERQTVENYLLVAGASFWTSDEYKAAAPDLVGHVGKFGIGFMSVFGIAERVVVETRHISSDVCWRFVIRSPRQCVRVEKCLRDRPGTTVIIYAKKDTLTVSSPLELFESSCSFPEFPIRLVVDGHVEVDVSAPRPPSTTDLHVTLVAERKPCSKTKLSKFDIERPGITGDFYIPKVFFDDLDCYIPSLRIHTWLSNTGWRFAHESAIYYGGINYPGLHAFGGVQGFTHLPSLGCLRLSVSPNKYPLEMTLARDNFVSGEGCLRLLHDVCALVDEKLESDLSEELRNKSDPSVRSTIAALYSGSMLHLWTGQVPSPSFVLSSPNRQYRAVGTNPWSKLAKLMMQEMQFLLADVSGHTEAVPMGSLIASANPVFAGGLVNGALSKDLVHAVASFDASSKLIVGIPHGDFGIMELRQWASDEILVPVPSHARCAYGLRFGADRAFQFYPRECDHLGIPLTTSSPRHAIVDYRDLMAEGSHSRDAAKKSF